MKASTKRRGRSDEQLLDHATDSLLKAVKEDMLKEEGRVDTEALRKAGYSERLIARLEED
jgi:hypothetical protein